MLITKSSLKANSPAVIDYFWETLNIPLQQWILSLKKPSTTFQDWASWASRLDNNFRRMQRILGRTDRGRTTPSTSEKKKEGNHHGRQWNFQKKDPNAMDIDAMTMEKWDEMMKKGLCFSCGKPGHLNKDCPEKKGRTGTGSTPPSYASTWAPNPNTPKKMTPKEMVAHVQSLTAQMNKKEKEEFYEEAEKEGF